MATREPTRLRDGKEFHARIQAEWRETAEGTVTVEAPIAKPDGRRGRVDVLVNRGQPLATVVEIKAADWDAMTYNALRRNVRRYANQVHKYIEAQLDEGSEVSPGIVFPRRPISLERLTLIEVLFAGYAIAVVWHDESIQECHARNDVG